MKATHTCPRVGVRREIRAAAPRHQDFNPRSGRTAGAGQDGRTCAAAWPAPAGLAVRAAGGPAAGRPLDLSRGHIPYNKWLAPWPSDVTLLSCVDGYPDNHGAAARAAQSRVRSVRGFARDLAQCVDGRCPAGLPGWAFSYAVTCTWCRQSHALDSVTRYGIPCSNSIAAPCSEGRHGGLGRRPGSVGRGWAPVRAPQAVRRAVEPQAPLPLRQWAPLEALPRQALSASGALGRGVPHG